MSRATLFHFLSLGYLQETVRRALEILLQKDFSPRTEDGSVGGLRTVTFAQGLAVDLGELTPSNFSATWSRIQWAGGTQISEHRSIR